ncbi:MAG: ExbD/TolR family protein [Gammaproteobacteria bacterium]
MSKARGRRLMGDINVVPYIDVMLVLLIIFMITAPLLTQGISVDLPEVGAEPLDPETLEQNEPLVVSIDRDGLFYLNVGGDPEAPIDEQTLRERIGAVVRQAPETPVFVKADQSAIVAQFARAMVLIQQAGASSVNMITDPLPEDEEP